MSMEKHAKGAALNRLMKILDSKQAEGMKGIKSKHPPKPAADQIEEDNLHKPKGFSQAWDELHAGRDERGPYPDDEKAAAHGGEVPPVDEPVDDTEGHDYTPDLPVADTQGKLHDTKDILSDDEKERITRLYRKHVLGE